jgi:hypothetical protein
MSEIIKYHGMSEIIKYQSWHVRNHRQSIGHILTAFNESIPLQTVKGTVSIGQIKGSNKVGKWKSCHQKREIEHFGVTMAKPLWSHAQGIGRKKIVKKLNY